MFKKICLGAVMATALLSTTAMAENWRIATEPTFAPFEFKDSKTGQFTGFDLELIAAIAEAVGDKAIVTPIGFDAIIPSLMSRTTDVAATGMTITEERAKKVIFTKPYYDAGLSVLIRKENAKKFKSIDDLKGCSVCVQIGTSGQMRAKEIPNAKVRVFNTQSDTFLELANRGCDAVVGDRPVIGYFMASKKVNEKIFKHLDQPLDPEQYGFAVAKDRPELAAKVQKGLDIVRKNGTYDRIYKKWFGK